MKGKLKILQMTTYPIDNPDHGGKLRCYHIRQALRQYFDVETLSFDYHNGAEKVEDFSVTLPHKKMQSVLGTDSYGYLLDWGINCYLKSNSILLQHIYQKVQTFMPDILLIEQGYLWPLAKMMLDAKVIRSDCFIIYSSHNVEYKMKEEIYPLIMSDVLAKQYVNIVERLEKDIITHADMILTVTEQDRRFYASIAPQASIEVYPNGHHGISHSSKREKWKKLFQQSQRNWVFIGSWHPPNINGIHRLLENGLKEISSYDVTLWVLGGAGPGFFSTYNVSEQHYSQLKVTGVVDDEDIDSAILEASGIVLPIWEGGGSNLKTAQALLSGKPIVGTAVAFRGFEAFQNQPGVYVDSEPMALVNYMKNCCIDQDIDRIKQVEQLRWENIFELLSSSIMKHIRLK